MENFTPPKAVRLKQDKCEITTCHSNTGFSCALSVYDHYDAIRPNKCYHRKFKLKNK